MKPKQEFWVLWSGAGRDYVRIQHTFCPLCWIINRTREAMMMMLHLTCKRMPTNLSPLLYLLPYKITHLLATTPTPKSHPELHSYIHQLNCQKKKTRSICVMYIFPTHIPIYVVWITCAFVDIATSSCTLSCNTRRFNLY